MSKIDVEYKVDKGIPIPVRRNKAVPLAQLEVGESIGFPIEFRANVASRASKLKAQGREYTIKKEDELTARIWRTK